MIMCRNVYIIRLQFYFYGFKFKRKLLVVGMYSGYSEFVFNRHRLRLVKQFQGLQESHQN